MFVVRNLTTSEWWEPSRPDRRLHGVLFEEEGRGWLLKLDGSFERIELDSHLASEGPITVPLTSPSEFPVLCGITGGGKLLTLFNCQVMAATWPLFGNSGQLVVWPTILAYDVHFENLDDFRLTSLSVRYSNLDAWAATSGFSIDLGSSDNYSVSIQYTKPEAIEVGTADGLTITLGFSASGPTITSPQAQVHLEQTAWVSVAASDGRPYEELLRTSTVLSDLITLGVGQPVRPLEMEGECNAQMGPGGPATSCSFKLVHNRDPISPILPDAKAWDMLFTFPEIRNRLPDLLCAWFDGQDTIGPLYALYFGTVRSPSMYVEHRFLNMFQALESYDRRTNVQDSEKAIAHRERLDRILNAVNSRDKKWLKGRLKHSHEPTAVDRIRRLVAKVHAGWLLDDNDVTLAADFRNFYTHFGLDVEQRLPPKKERSRKLHNLAIRLQMLCEITLLDAIGFSSDEVRERIERTRRLENRLTR